MTGDDRPDWRKRTDATLRELEALEQTMAEQAAREPGRIGQRLDELSQGPGDVPA